MPVPKLLKVLNATNAPEIKKIAWIVEGFLARGAGTILFGQPGVSKTAHVAVLCAALLTGKDFGKLKVKGRNLRVLYVDLDGGWDWTAPLFYAAFRSADIKGLPKGFHYFSPLSSECLDESGETEEVIDYLGMVNLEEIGLRLQRTVKHLEIDVLIIDSLGQFMAGDMNDSQAVSLAFRLGLNPSRMTGAAVLILDHSTKAARLGSQATPTPTGSQMKRAWARCTVALEDAENQGSGCKLWTVDKSNARAFEPFLTRLHFENDGEELVGLTLEFVGHSCTRRKFHNSRSGDAEASEFILERLSRGAAPRKELGSGGTYQRALDKLMKANTVEKLRHGFYGLSKAQKPD